MQTERRALGVVAGVFSGLMLLLALAVTAGPDLVQRTALPTTRDRNPAPEVMTGTAAPASPTTTADLASPRLFDLPPWLSGVVTVLALLLLAVLAHAVWRWLRDRSPARGREDARIDDLPVPPPLIDERQAAVQRAALAEGEPRNAIVACWVELERLLAAAGTERDPARTPTELARKVLAHHRAPEQDVERLLEAYREARFSRHEITEQDRAAAADALTAIHRALGRTP